jgi:hypothetical protein
MKADLIADNEINPGCLRSPYGGGNGPTVRVGPARIIPFPMAARVAFLERMTVLIAMARPSNRQGYREHLERQQYESLRKRGLPADVIETEMAIYNRELDWRLAAMGCA